MDSANDSVASLKAALASAHQALAEAEQAAKDAQAELSMREAEDVDRHQTLRSGCWASQYFCCFFFISRIRIRI